MDPLSMLPAREGQAVGLSPYRRRDNEDMAIVSIGDFSRMSFLSVKTLRHYHDIGLLLPVVIDPSSGYRRYSTDQLPQAQVIVRLRRLGMPLEEIKAVLASTDVERRNLAISSHLERMERQLAQTRDTVASLRRMLGEEQPPATIEHRRLDGCWTFAIGTEIAISGLSLWLDAARSRLADALTATGLRRAGPDGSLYFQEFFTEGGIRELDEIGTAEVIAYLPVDRKPDPGLLDDAGFGDVYGHRLPAVDVALLTHRGHCGDLDRSYARIGGYVTERAIGVAGPIREHHLDPLGTPVDKLRTEVGWPIFPVAG